MNIFSRVTGLVVFLGALCIIGCGRKKEIIQPKITEHELLARSESQKFFDARPSEKTTSYLYVPGLTGTEVMMGRYCPRFTAVTGEKLTWRSGGHTIGLPHSAVVFPEIDLRKPNYFTLNPITSIVNSVRRDLFPLACRMFQDMFDFTVEDNPASSKSVVNYSPKFGSANIGQRKDIKALRKAYEKHIEQYSGTDVVLYGDSRGAVTIFNFIALHNPAHVRAAVIEGIFDDIPHLMKHFIYHDKEACSEKRMLGILNFVMGDYNKKGPFPRDYAEQIADDIPLLFVTSLKDGLCAPQGALYLYNRLKERGHKKIHLLVLKKSWHPCYMINDADDKAMYEQCVHAFYKHYGLPHNSAQAIAGTRTFKASQPSVDEVKQLYPLQKCSMCFDKGK